MDPSTPASVFPLLVLVLSGAFGFYWYRRANRRRLEAIAVALSTQGATVGAVDHARSLISPGRVPFQLDGRRGYVTSRAWARSTSRWMFEIEGAKRPGMWIRRGTGGISQVLGLEKPRTIAGHPVMIATLANDETIDRLLASEEAQRLIVGFLSSSSFTEFVGLGTRVMLSPDGLALVKFTNLWMPFNPGIAVQILRRLEELDAALPKVEEREVTPLRDSHSFAPSVFVPMVALGLSIPFLSFVTFPLAISNAQLMMALGILPALIVAWALLRLYRGRPHGVREWFFTAFGAVGATPFVFAALLAAVNSSFDSSEPATHHVKMLDYYKGNSHTVWVESWDPAVTREKVIVPKSIAHVSPGDALDVTTKKGALGWPWAVSVAKE